METKRKNIKYLLQQGYRLQTIMHYVNRETLIKHHDKQKEGKASGVGGVTKEMYNQNLEENISKLIKKMKSFSCRPKKLKYKFEVVKGCLLWNKWKLCKLGNIL